MTVKQLIKKLSKFDQDDIVVTDTPDGLYYETIKVSVSYARPPKEDEPSNFQVPVHSDDKDKVKNTHKVVLLW